MYCQIVGKKSLKRSVFTITLCCFLKSTCGIAQSTNVKSGNMTQIGGWIPSGFYFLPFVYLFFLQDKGYNMEKERDKVYFVGFQRAGLLYGDSREQFSSREKEFLPLGLQDNGMGGSESTFKRHGQVEGGCPHIEDSFDSYQGETQWSF